MLFFLEEYAYSYPIKSKKHFYKRDYYARIKILKKNAFDLATINIPSFKKGDITNIEAITYNLSNNGTISKTSLENKNIKENKINNYLYTTSFILPNIKEGSVIEYKYTIASDSYGIYDWSFQSKIPKITTSYTADFSLAAPYHVRLIRYLKPFKYENTIKNNCLSHRKCKSLKYTFKNVPSFIKEDYITSEKNYISRVSFEKNYLISKLNDENQWSELDKAFKRTYEDLLNKEKKFKKVLPKNILNEKNELEKAKKIYYYILNEYKLDNKSNDYFYKALKNKKGTSGQLNLALYNALKASGLKDVKLMFLSTRKNGYITKLHATLESFNYRIVRLLIDNKIYYLDATQKNAPFGLIPFMCLSGDARVLDFKNGSFWEKPFSTEKTYRKINILSKLIDDKLIGKIRLTSNGYNALDRRLILKKTNNKSKIIDLFESKNPFCQVEKYTNKNLDNTKSPMIEDYEVVIPEIIQDNKYISLSNILLHFMYKENPFKLKERLYPVNFGFPRTDTFLISIEIPKNYIIKSLPEDLLLSLNNNASTFTFKSQEKNNLITIKIKLNINETIYLSDEYKNLKEFISRIIESQNSFIEFKKI